MVLPHAAGIFVRKKKDRIHTLMQGIFYPVTFVWQHKPLNQDLWKTKFKRGNYSR